jgi:peptidoglycan/LPS O-acetylase OafA/YrhL
MLDPGRAHVRALDGVRGLAIGLVLLYHGFTYERFGGGIGHYIDSVRLIGWVGVDVFFVMSGFLITGILLESKGQPRYWRNFLIRRGLRIFPLYYAVLILILVGTLAMPELSKSGVATIWVNFAYITNFWIARYGENHVPLDIAWSLAVEEQFYIVYPWVVRFCKPRTLAIVLVSAMIAAPVLRYLTFEYGAQPQLGPYVLPYTRMDALAVGALVRLAFDRPQRPLIAMIARWAPLLCAMALAVTLTWPRGAVVSDVRYVVVGYSVTAIAGASLLARILIAAPTSPLRRAFEWGPLVYLGKVSYCVYLIHLIARVVVAKALGHVFAPGDRGLAFCTVQLVLMVALAVAGATLSYRYFERPILALKDRWAPVAKP